MFSRDMVKMLLKICCQSRCGINSDYMETTCHTKQFSGIYYIFFLKVLSHLKHKARNYRQYITDKFSKKYDRTSTIGFKRSWHYIFFMRNENKETSIGFKLK